MIKRRNETSLNLLGTTIWMEYSLTHCPQLRLATSRQRRKRSSSSNLMLNFVPNLTVLPGTFITIERHRRITNAQTNLPIYTAQYTFNRNLPLSSLSGRLIKRILESLSSHSNLDPINSQTTQQSLVTNTSTTSSTTIKREVQLLARLQNQREKLRRRWK